MLQAVDVLSSTTECVFANNVAFGEMHNARIGFACI